MAPSSKKNEPYLPKQIRDELRMTAAMRCYSVLREGDGKKLSEFYSSMFDLYHGNESSSIPSHINLLCKASFCFRALYDTKTKTTTNKNTTNNQDDTETYVLKPQLARGTNQSFISNVDISVKDLEKKNRSGAQLMSGRQLLDMAKRGTKFYRKALAYASRKFDLETMTCKESGSTVDDVIRYVLVQMYKDAKNKPDDDDDDGNKTIEDDNDCEGELILDSNNQVVSIDTSQSSSNQGNLTEDEVDSNNVGNSSNDKDNNNSIQTQKEDNNDDDERQR